jgi:hypothetical protein
LSSYKLTLQGYAPVSDGYKDAEANGDRKEMMDELCNITQCMHIVKPPLPGQDVCEGITSWMNPARLVCTCKGFRGFGLCAHCIAVTAHYYSSEHYGVNYLKGLFDPLVPNKGRKKAANRPRKTVGGMSRQPKDHDSEEEGEEEEEEEEAEAEEFGELGGGMWETGGGLPHFWQEVEGEEGEEGEEEEEEEEEEGNRKEEAEEEGDEGEDSTWESDDDDDDEDNCVEHIDDELFLDDEDNYTDHIDQAEKEAREREKEPPMDSGTGTRPSRKFMAMYPPSPPPRASRR